MSEGYRVEQTADRVLVFGSIPITALVALMRTWAKAGLTVVEPGIGTALGATLAVSRPEAVEAWRGEIAASAAERAAGDPAKEWIMGVDVGTSSLTIFSVLALPELAIVALKKNPFPGSTPLDAADFGRCSRLLDTVPGWRERVVEVAERYPGWKPFVRDWAYLETLYQTDLAELTRVLHRFSHETARSLS